MRYIFHLFQDPSRFEQMTSEQQAAGVEAYMAYTQALKDAGVYVGADRLQLAAEST